MTISLFDPRSMARALMEMPPARAFLTRMFFDGVGIKHSSEHIDVDIQTGVRRAAPYTSPAGPGKAVDRIGFTTHTFRSPMVAPKMALTVPDLQSRLPGEHIYSGADANSRAKALLGKDLGTLDDMIVRRIEIMVRDGLVDGEIDVLGDDVDYTITFPPRDATLIIGTLAAADRWSAAGTSDPIKNLRAWRRAIQALTGLTADVCILGSDAVDALLANAAVQALLDNRRMDLGQLKPELMDSGATFVGRLGGVDLWGYDELDPDGNPLIAVKTILMGSTAARCEVHYGAVGVATGEGNDARIALVPAERVPESWVTKEPPVRQLKVSSRPLPIPIQNNGFLTAQVLA